MGTKINFPTPGGGGYERAYPLAFHDWGKPTGNVFFVDSNHAAKGDTAGHGHSPEAPFATLAYAFSSGRLTANNDDVVVIAPGHVETVTAANGVDMTTAGVKVIGLGHGGARPQINLTTVVGASVRVNANSIWLQNLRFTGGLDNITTVLTVNGKTDVTLKDIEYLDVTGQCAKFFHAANNSDRLTIDGFRHIGDSAAGSTHSLTFDGCDDLILRNFKIVGNFSTAGVGFITTASARVDIRYGTVWNQNSADVSVVDTITGSTGQLSNLNLTCTDNAANITEAITGATFHIDGDTVWVVNAVNEKAMAINWAASTDA